MAAVTPQQLISRTVDLANTNDADGISAATIVARDIAAEPTKILVTVYDKFWVPVGECHDYMDLMATRPRNKVPILTMVLKGTDPLVPIMRNCRNELVGITVEVGALRWAYTVDTATYKLESGQRTLTVKALGLFAYFDAMFVWPQPALPIQAQIPSRAVYVGPLCTVIETMIAQNAFRLQSGSWELVNNLGSLNPDWRAWLGTALEARGDLTDQLHTPIYVIRSNFLSDASPFVAVTSRMESIATVIEKLVKSYGVTVDIELWLPGDPQPDQWARLRLPTYVVRVSDRSNVTGPTNSILDSVIKQMVTVEESVLGGVLAPMLNPQGQYAPVGVYIAPAIGVNYVKPWCVLIDHPRGPIENFEIVDHHPQAHTIIIGGKSPKWINDLINATLSWALDCIMIVVGLTGVPSGLLDGLFNDVLMAFQLIENFKRRNDGGPYMHPERFVSTGAAPYNVDALFSFISAMFDSRGYRSATAQFRNGYPYSVGRDIFVGAMMSIVENDIMFSDYIEQVVITDNRRERCKVVVQIGDGKAEEAPIARFQRLITGVQEAVNVLTLAPGQ